MSSLRRYVIQSDQPAARFARWLIRSIRRVSVPAPQVVFKPILWLFLAARAMYQFLMRVFICEPFFKMYCTRYGRNLRTDSFIHWVMGKGDLIVGDDVLVDGKCTFAFAARFSEKPTLEIGNKTEIANGCTFVVGKRITIGRHCRISAGSSLFDSNGHPADPVARRENHPPHPSEVRPIVIGDDVWIGQRSLIGPGVKIGDGSIVAANSVVRTRVAPYTVVAGNPAIKIADLPRPGPVATDAP
jgi:acetyltransferase-like isoleucine patch superfamily enzyme